MEKSNRRKFTVVLPLRSTALLSMLHFDLATMTEAISTRHVEIELANPYRYIPGVEVSAWLSLVDYDVLATKWRANMKEEKVN